MGVDDDKNSAVHSRDDAYQPEGGGRRSLAGCPHRSHARTITTNTHLQAASRASTRSGGGDLE
jgi:hypothetical protein